MPTISFTSDFMSLTGSTPFIDSFLRTGAANVNPNLWEAGFFPTSGNSGAYPQGKLFIMKGTIPSDFSALTNRDSRSSDRLIAFNPDNTGSGATLRYAGSVVSNPVLIQSQGYATASASGTATWFHISCGFGFSSTDPILQQAYGTVGGTGSGADLEISNTNIVSGQSYRIFNLRMQFPTSFTY